MLQTWDTIINAAMIGTDKRQVAIDEMPEALRAVATLIHDNQPDKELAFLQLAASTFNYRQCGFKPLQKQVETIAAPTEEKTYCNEAAAQALRDIISEDSNHLLKMWLQLCDLRQQIVRPEMIPVLLAKGTDQKDLQLIIASCCGKRGEWLANFNAAWKFSSTQSHEELWQTGTPEQRKTILKQIRHQVPAKAREWLQVTWPQEDANTKAAFLELLSVNISNDDIPFLESLATEKSKKVKELAIQQLKLIPQSAIVRLYENTLSEAVSIKKEKALLGMMTKTSLQVRLPDTVNEAIYKSGIDKLSNSKDYTDDEYVVYQLAQYVPPAFWEQHLAMNPEQVINLFLKDASAKKILPAIAAATARFKDTRWAENLLRHSDIIYTDLISLLLINQQQQYSIKHFAEHPDNIIRQATAMNIEWSTELTRTIFRHLAKNPYQYNRSFYNQNIHLIPAAIINELAGLAPPETYLGNTWTNTSEYITRLLTLKTQTIKAFNS